MEKYVIWKNHKVIGYIELTKEQKEQLNGTHGIGVYFGFDDKVRPSIHHFFAFCTKRLYTQQRIIKLSLILEIPHPFIK